MQKISQKLRQEVLEYIKTIPKWYITTYKLLATKFNTHPRTISSIMKYNKDPIKYPCYKVISHSWELSWYNTKRWVCEKIEKLQKDWIEIINKKINTRFYFIN